MQAEIHKLGTVLSGLTEDPSREEIVHAAQAVGLAPYPQERNLYGEHSIHMNHFVGMCQNPEELADLLTALRTHRISSFLEIGSAYGWTATFIHHILKKRNPDLVSYSVDNQSNPYAFLNFHSGVHFVQGTSRTVSRHAFDLVLIDGDHSYEGVKYDYEQVGCKARLCVFHDVDDDQCPGVMRFWSELPCRHIKFVACQGRLGIGLAVPGARML